MELLTDTSFQNLNKTEQVGAVIRLGKELIVRVTEDFSIHLYIMPNIFIEVWYEARTNVIVKLNTTNRQEIIKNYDEMNDIVHYLFKDANL
jgi:hypothetical protein